MVIACLLASLQTYIWNKYSSSRLCSQSWIPSLHHNAFRNPSRIIFETPKQFNHATIDPLSNISERLWMHPLPSKLTSYKTEKNYKVGRRNKDRSSETGWQLRSCQEFCKTKTTSLPVSNMYTYILQVSGDSIPNLALDSLDPLTHLLTRHC